MASARTHIDGFQDAVDVNVVTDYRLRIQVVGGLVPDQNNLVPTPILYPLDPGHRGWCRVIGVARFGRHGEGIARRRKPCPVLGLDRKGVGGFRFQQVKGAGRLGRRLPVQVAVFENQIAKG